MRPVGSESADDRALREWFSEHEKRNLDRLEDGAKTIVQLVTGLYGLLFAVLAISNQPVYLRRPTVQWLGTLGMLAFFVALLSALVTLFPWRSTFQEDNLSEMKRVNQTVLNRKFWSLGAALGAFLVGVCLLAIMITAVLWGW
jgi:hypothetical protein